MHRTKILQQYLFPVFPRERYLPEGVVWGRVVAGYRTKCINVPLRLFHDTAESVSTKVLKLRYACGTGYQLYYLEELARHQKAWKYFKLAANYIRTSLGMHNSYQKIIANSPRNFWAVIAMPLGTASYFRDRQRGLTKAGE